MLLECEGFVWQLDGMGGMGHEFLSDRLRCRQQGQTTLNGSLQHGSWNKESVNLIGPFPDAVDPVIPVGPLSRIFGDIPISSQNLNILINTVVGNL